MREAEPPGIRNVCVALSDADSRAIAVVCRPRGGEATIYDDTGGLRAEGVCRVLCEYGLAAFVEAPKQGAIEDDIPEAVFDFFERDIVPGQGGGEKDLVCV